MQSLGLLAQKSCLKELYQFDHPPTEAVHYAAPLKDYFTLARAARRILQAEPQTRFLIVGDYTSAKTYREHYQGVRQVLEECCVADSFIFTGHRQDVSRLLSAFDVFVLSTHREGLPLVILEAMAQAKPVVRRPSMGFQR